MARRVVGLDIGTSAVRAVELSVGSGSPEMIAVGQVGLPRGAVVEGEIARSGAVVEALRRLWNEAGFGVRDVHVSLAGFRAITREMTMAAVPATELTGAVRYQAGELIPFPPEKTLVDAQVLGTLTGANGDHLERILVGAAHQDLVTGVVSALEEAKLVPVGVDLASSALVRATAAGREPSEEPEAVIAVGAGLTLVVIHRFGRPDFVRTIGSGGDAVTDAIASTLGLPKVDAEMAKRRSGVPPSQLEPAEARTMAAVEAAARPAVSDLVTEVRGSLEYYAGLPDRPTVERVTLTGGGAHLHGFPEELAHQLGRPTAWATSLAGVGTGALKLAPEQLRYLDGHSAVAVGTALAENGSGSAFDLVPPEVSARLRARRVKSRLAVGAAAVLALLLLGFAARFLQVHDAERSVASSQASITQLRSNLARYNNVVQANKAIADDQSRILPVVDSEVSWTTVLDQLSRQIPSSVVLTSLTGQIVQAPAPAPAPAPSKGGKAAPQAPAAPAGLPAPSAVVATLTVTATDPAYTGGADWITQMDASPAFRNVFITDLSRGAPSGSSGSAGSSASSGSGSTVTFSSTVDVTGAAHTTRLPRFQETVS